MKELKREDAIFALVGNKLDLADDQRQVKKEEGQAMATSKDYLFKEVSAKDGTGINDLFYIDIFDKISKKYGLVESNEEQTKKAVENIKETGGKIRLGDKDNKVKKKEKGYKKCCNKN